MGKTVKDFESSGKRQVLNKQLMDWLGPTKKIVKDKLEKNSTLQRLFDEGKLELSTIYRTEQTISNVKIGGVNILEDQIDATYKDVDEASAAKQKLDGMYDSEDDFDDIMKETINAIPDTTENLGDGFNNSTIDALKNKDFRYSIELFPGIEVSDNSVERFDCYYDGRIEMCPRSFPGTNIPAPNEQLATIAHEGAHAIDNMLNGGTAQSKYASVDALKETIYEYYPNIDTEEVAEEVREALSKSARFVDEDFVYNYDIDGIIVQGNNGFEVNVEADASAEYVAFHAENIFTQLEKSNSIDAFKQNMAEHMDNVLNQEDLSAFEKSFALDVMDSTTKAYLDQMRKAGQSAVVDAVNELVESRKDQVYDELNKEAQDETIEAAENSLDAIEGLIDDEMSMLSDFATKSMEYSNGAASQEISSIEEANADLDQLRDQIQNYKGELREYSSSSDKFSKTDLEDIQSQVKDFSQQFSDLSTQINADIQRVDLTKITRDQNQQQQLQEDVDQINNMDQQAQENDEQTKENFEELDKYENFLPE